MWQLPSGDAHSVIRLTDGGGVLACSTFMAALKASSEILRARDKFISPAAKSYGEFAVEFEGADFAGLGRVPVQSMHVHAISSFLRTAALYLLLVIPKQYHFASRTLHHALCFTIKKHVAVMLRYMLLK